MFNALRKSLRPLMVACLLLASGSACAHFLLNLNVRVFHVEHVKDGLNVYLRTPMPYLVADKIGAESDDGLPAAAPFTTNALEGDKVVHFVDLSQVASVPLGLGQIAEAGTRIEVDGARVKGYVKAVVLHHVGSEPGFATLAEAQDVIAKPTTLPKTTPAYVGDVIVDVLIVYKMETAPSRYLISSELDPGLPDQRTTANLLLDYAPGEPLILRSRGLLAKPIEVSRSRLAAFATFVWEGVRHILEGIDHVLFVACLVIGAPSLRDLLWRVTGFTVGHSVTLSLGFWGLVPSGVWFVPAVETGIALSIIYAALLAMRSSSRTAEANRNIFFVTVLIGFLHGLGFSFVLKEILQITSPNIWQSLLAFNVGVEIGQIAIVLLIWPLLYLVEKASIGAQNYVRWGIAIICCAVAAWWTFERSMGVITALSS
ncbi:HupE/UreJ family protein [Falsiphaeobacter marinintestinus]|uniref:HupE/UreJ family protein n=1 Tax=Falsiphaeobacter marinintestinus TaxID=1492905 RepID=UPI0011B38DF8|nr:HupE/UreJ family protein [Phaeobacter marinintestinus]